MLKSLNQLTLIALNSLISREYTETDKGIVERNHRFLFSQLHIIDSDGTIADLFESMFLQISKLEILIPEAGSILGELQVRVGKAAEKFDQAVKGTELEEMTAKAESEVRQANAVLKETSRHNLITVIIFLIGVPVLMIGIGIAGLNTLVLRPITRLINAMKDLENGSFDSTISIDSRDEIGALARGFNAMAGEIRAQVMEMEQLNAVLKAGEARYRTLVNNIPQKIFYKDRELAYVSCNLNFALDIGIDEEENIRGMTDFDIFPESQAKKYRDGDLRVINTETSEEFEEDYIHNGEKRIVQTVKTPVRDSQGNISGVLGIFWDITERKKLESQLIQAQKMESVGRLAGGVAHDFNNMLSIILGNTEIILEDIPSSSSLVTNLQEIYRAAERSTSLTRQLLAFARKQTVAPRVIDINDAMEAMLKMLQKLIGEDIDLAWRPGKDPAKVKIDPSQIDQIIVNLCVNARDAIKGVGKLTIETGNVSIDTGYCQTHSGFTPGEYVMIAVTDNGCGMDRHTLDNLFEPFFTTKAVGLGSGLGLATVYGIVRQNLGFINVYSEPNEGTAFRIYLPRHMESGTEGHPEDMDAIIPVGNETILLVEDEKAILRTAVMMIRRLGYNVLSASSPDEALGIAYSADSPIDLLITDVIMPEMSGRDLAEKLVHSYPELRVLFMSGYTANVIAHHGVLEKGIHFIHKPFSKKSMAVKIRQVLASPPAPLGSN